MKSDFMYRWLRLVRSGKSKTGFVRPQQKNQSLPETIKMEYTKPQIEDFIKKADKWDALGAEINKCYCNADIEFDEENSEIEGADLCTIGEKAASAFGWL
jgi:hypothetical protein